MACRALRPAWPATPSPARGLTALQLLALAPLPCDATLLHAHSTQRTVAAKPAEPAAALAGSQSVCAVFAPSASLPWGLGHRAAPAALPGSTGRSRITIKTKHQHGQNSIRGSAELLPTSYGVGRGKKDNIFKIAKPNEYGTADSAHPHSSYAARVAAGGHGCSGGLSEVDTLSHEGRRGRSVPAIIRALIMGPLPAPPRPAFPLRPSSAKTASERHGHQRLFTSD